MAAESTATTRYGGIVNARRVSTEQQERDRARARAYQRAWARLQLAHEEEFEVYYAEECWMEGVEGKRKRRTYSRMVFGIAAAESTPKEPL